MLKFFRVKYYLNCLNYTLYLLAGLLARIKAYRALPTQRKGKLMSIENWLTDKAIKALFDKLEKGAVTVSGLDPEGRELVLWASQPGRSSKDSSKKGSK